VMGDRFQRAKQGRIPAPPRDNLAHP
jgi:hypothetical protein